MLKSTGHFNNCEKAFASWKKALFAVFTFLYFAKDMSFTFE